MSSHSENPPEQIIDYEAVPGHRWYNRPGVGGPDLTEDEIDRFLINPNALIPDFEPIPYPQQGNDSAQYKFGRVPVAGGEGYQIIAVHVFKYSKATQAVHKAIHRMRRTHRPISGGVHSDFEIA